MEMRDTEGVGCMRTLVECSPCVCIMILIIITTWHCGGLDLASVPRYQLSRLKISVRASTISYYYVITARCRQSSKQSIN
jgi:hypothetical protein